MFDFFKKNKTKQEETKLATTLEQVRKAYEDLSEDDKKSFHQSISDRVHESIAAQERADGNENNQSAEAREHEALGAEHAAGHGDVAELHERDDTEEEKRENRHEEAQDRRDDRQESEADYWRKRADERMDKLEAMVKSLAEGKANDESAADKMAKAFGVGNGVFPSEAREEAARKATPEEIRKTISKLM